jgi:hypothetical protein
MMRNLLLPILLSLGCGLDPAKIASHRVFVTDGTEFVAPTRIQFAVVGNTRGMHPAVDRGSLGHGDVTHQLVGDIIAATIMGGPKFVVLTGDMVRSSSSAEWADFDDRFVGLLAGATAPPARTTRIPVIAAAGDRDGAGDEAYTGLSAAFPGSGASIGHGRVATWSHFDIRSGEARWRFIILDSNKAAMGSRWREQLTWIPQAVQGQFSGIIVVVHDPALSLGGQDRGSENTRVLLQTLDRVAPMDSVKAVLSGGPRVSQAFLPEGALGMIHIGAGGGGAPAQDLLRTAQSSEGPPLKLASGFDKALLSRIGSWSSSPLDPKIVERAQASGAFEGTGGVFDAGDYPTYGWWRGEIEGASLRLTWRRWQPNGTFRDAWSITHTRATGWAEPGG